MDITAIRAMLKKFGMKLTAPRLKVLETFFSFERGITYNEIIAVTAKAFDRVTVYRTLKSFEDAGFIHRITGLSDVPTYALSISSTHATSFGHQQHIHFSCIKCHGVFCLDTQEMPVISLPEQYLVHAINLTVIGLCDACNRTSQ